MAADGKAVGFVAHPLEEVEHRVAGFEPLSRCRPQETSRSRPASAVRAFRDSGDRHVAQAQVVEHAFRHIELAAAAVDQHQPRP